jgi:flagellar protein FliS
LATAARPERHHRFDQEAHDPMTYATGVEAYAETKVATTTNQKDLIVMAYDGILRFLNRAKAEMAAKEIEATHNSLVKARALVEELASTLDMDKGGKFAQNLWNLYLYFFQKITEANLRKDPTIIDEILPIITDLRDGWAGVEIPGDDATAQAANRRVPIATEKHRVSITG